MSLFLALCLVSRLAYAVNDVLVGGRSREYGRLEVAALRGVSLGLTMAPLLLWVPAAAWPAFGRRWPAYLLLIAVTAAANVLQNRAARFLPLGLRAALMISASSVVSLALGALALGERLSLEQAAFCVLLVGSAVVAATGEHAAHEIQPDIPRGSGLGLAAGTLLGVAALLTKRLAAETHPLLTAWAWEFGAGAVLVPALLVQWRRRVPADAARRFAGIAAAAAPTVVGSGASIAAINLGPLALWAALGGSQVLFTALVAMRRHREHVGLRRWLCFAAAAAAVAGLALRTR